MPPHRICDDISLQVISVFSFQGQTRDAVLDPSSQSMADALGNAAAFARIPEIGSKPRERSKCSAPARRK